MNCNELVELVTEYLEGTLPKSDVDRFHAHMRECPSCIEYLGQMRALLFTLGRIPLEAIEPVARERLRQTFRDWKPKET